MSEAFDHLDSLVRQLQGEVAHPRALGSFRAWQDHGASAVTFAANAFSDPVFDAEDWDESGWFAGIGGIYRFTPQLAGIYQLRACLTSDGALPAGTAADLYVCKNGSPVAALDLDRNESTASTLRVGGSCRVDADGVGDYFTARIFVSSAAPTNWQSSAVNCYFEGELVGRL